MYTAKIENLSGSVYVLTGDEPVYQVIGIRGLNPPKAQINTTTIVGLDGAVFNSSKLETRNIVLTIKINGDVETNRLNLYRYFRTKEWCKFYYSNESVDVFIEGYVETVECDLFSNSETAQISIICPYPYFKSVEQIIDDISNTIALFTFPFSIDYDDPIPFSNFILAGEVNVFNSTATETGVEIQIDISASVNEIEIQNTVTGDNITLDYSFLTGDRVIINTNKGQKSVKLIRNGNEINIFSAVQRGSVFFQLAAGDNIFAYLIDDGENNANVNILFKHYDTYRGV